MKAAVRNRILLLLTPIVALGIVLASFVASAVGGPAFRPHALMIQLFLLATIPRGLYQVVLVELNVDRRPRALALCGGVFACATMAGFAAGLLLHATADVLPAAWVGGGLGVLLFSRHLARRPVGLTTWGSNNPQNR